MHREMYLPSNYYDPFSCVNPRENVPSNDLGSDLAAYSGTDVVRGLSIASVKGLGIVLVKGLGLDSVLVKSSGSQIVTASDLDVVSDVGGDGDDV